MPLLTPLPEVGVRRVAWEEGGTTSLLREVRGQASVRFRGEERTVTVEFPVRIVHRTCPGRSRRACHYYTALIQLRGPEGWPAGPAWTHRQRLHERWDALLPEARANWRKALSWEEVRPVGRLLPGRHRRRPRARPVRMKARSAPCSRSRRPCTAARTAATSTGSPFACASPARAGVEASPPAPGSSPTGPPSGRTVALRGDFHSIDLREVLGDHDGQAGDPAAAPRR